MKKTILKNLKFIIIGLVVASSFTALAAGTWNDPTANAPANNVAVPIHTGPDQVKTTATCVSGNCGGLSVGPFAVFSNAEFDQQVFFNGMIRGGSATTTDSQVNFGDTSHEVNGTVAGNVSAVGALQSKSVANASSSPLCAGTDGTIVVCGAAPTATESYSIAAQEVVWPIPDYDYTENLSPQDDYYVAFCLNTPAQRSINFTVEYTSDKGVSRTVNVTIPFGQSCVNTGPANTAQEAPHTDVGNASAQCLYNTADPYYQSPVYQGYSVDVDPSLRCQ
jgi:hypothetical protein